MNELQQRRHDEDRRRRQSYCPHLYLTTSITHPLICTQCQLDHSGILLVALNNRLNATITALALLGLEPCSTCQTLTPKADLLPLPVNVDEAPHDEQLHQLHCATCAVSRIEMAEIALTDDQLRWFGEHRSADQLPSWLRDEMTDRIGYRSLDLPSRDANGQ